MSHKELARFSAGGKTFFFNEMRAKNDARYLSINAIWGQGNKQRMTLFVPQLLDYARCLDEAIASITGMTRNIVQGRLISGPQRLRTTNIGY